MYRTDFWTLWQKARVGCFKRTASKHVYYLVWNRSPSQAGCMRQVLRPGALGRPRGIGWRGRWEGGSGWGIHVNPWLIHVDVWQKPLQYCKVISLQLIKISEKKKKKQLNVLLPYNLGSTLLDIYPKEMQVYVHTKAYTDIYSSFIHNYQNFKTIRISFNRGMNK